MKKKPYFWPVLGAFIALFIFQASASFGAVTKEATNTRDAYAPFEEILQITPSNSTEYSPPLRGCIVEADGDLALVASKNTSGATVTITVKASQLVPVLITKVMASTTATVVCGR